MEQFYLVLYFVAVWLFLGFVIPLIAGLVSSIGNGGPPSSGGPVSARIILTSDFWDSVWNQWAKPLGIALVLIGIGTHVFY